VTYKNSYLIIVLILIALISGCASTSRVPIISENEAFKYERDNLTEYENSKNSYSDQSAVKWVQPKNKKIPCKVYVGISVIEDRTLDKNYKIFWDGDCKNGYANGLGREFERSTILNMEALAIYQGQKEEPKYYIQKYHLDNKVQEGDIKNRYFVETTINEDNFNFNITYKYGFLGSLKEPYQMVIQSSPFSDIVLYEKNYPNFRFQLFDLSNDEFQQNKYAFYMLNKDGQKHGFGFETPKSGNTKGGEFINGSATRLVGLPKGYFNKANNIFSEIKQAGQKAIDAQSQALKVKKQYMRKICKNSVSVSFIDNEEYKKICRDSDYYANLKEKMNVKLAQINKVKQQKREQLNQQKLVNAQVSQANAAQRQANAAARSASAAERSNSMQSWQNLNNNLQMQQLNNNLMFMRMGY